MNHVNMCVYHKINKLQVVAWMYMWSKVVVLDVTIACSVFLVFEYCAHDLGRLLDTMPRRFHESEVKCLLKQVQLMLSYLLAV